MKDLIKFENYNDGGLDISFGPDIPKEYIDYVIKSLVSEGMMCSFINGLETMSFIIPNKLQKNREKVGEKVWQLKQTGVPTSKQMYNTMPKSTQNMNESRPALKPNIANTYDSKNVPDKVKVSQEGGVRINYNKPKKYDPKEVWKKEDEDPIKKHFEQKTTNQLANKINGMLFPNLNAWQQPTDEQLFGSLVKTQEEVNTFNNQNNDIFNDFMREVTKPLNQGKTEEEQLEYWNSIKIDDSEK